MIWEPDFNIDLAIALALIRKQFPELEIKSFEACGHGWDNSLFMLNQNTIFRFPRREIALEGCKTELAVLKRLSKLLSIKIPIPEYIGVPCDRYPYPFWGYQKLPGITACHKKLSREERIDLTLPIAQFLKELHTIQDPTIVASLKPDPFARFELRSRAEKGITLIHEIKKMSFQENWLIFENYFHEIDKNIVDHDKVVVHGDLYARHFLLDDCNKLLGIIDWGDLHYGNPAVDLEILFDFLPRESRALFIGEYGPIKDEVLALAQFRATYHTLMLLQYAHSINDSMLLQECQVGLQLIAENLVA